jgi:hypothetical protein
MTKAKSRPTPPDAEKFAEIAAECARVCGVDVRLTPLAAVPVQVVPAPTAPGTLPAVIACLGVRFDDEYVIVRLPTGGFRAFKVNPEGRVVLRLNVRGGFRAHVSRVFGALIWDRLKRGASRYEPQLALLPTESSVPLVAESSHVEDPGPAAPAPREVMASPPRPQTQAKEPPETSSSPAPTPPPSTEPASAPTPKLPVASAPSPDPRAPGPGPPVVPPTPSSALAAAPGAPLSSRLRGPRSK